MKLETQVGGYLLLDSTAGWRAASMSALLPQSDGSLAVDCVTGQPKDFAAKLTSQLAVPTALVCDRTRSELYLIDQADSRVKKLNLTHQNEVVALAGVGGKGRDARRFRKPGGLSILADGSLAIADTGNHQVKIFSAFPHALLAVWGTGRPGSGEGEFHSPVKVVADRCGLLYIADRGNGRVQRIHRDGRVEKPITDFEAPTRLALSGDGILAVIDSGNVMIFMAGRTTSSVSFKVQGASCLTFDGNGYLYVGTDTALVYKFVPDRAKVYRAVGVGVTGIEGQFLDLVWMPEKQLVGLILPRCTARPLLKSICTCGAHVRSGRIITRTLDSGLEACVWDRIALEASVPVGTMITVTTQTSEIDQWSDATTGQTLDISGPTSDSLALTGDNPDCLVQSQPGRYLRIQITLQTNTVTSPVLRRVKVYFPRQSYLQYLPAIYQEDDESRVFLDRFLSVFQTTFDGMDRTIDNLWMLFDPMSVPEIWFPWLAGWLALPINPTWTDTQRRVALKSAGKLYPKRGTRGGIETLIKEYSDVDARLVEHYKLRNLMILSEPISDSGQRPQPTSVPSLSINPLCVGGRLWSRDYYQRLQLGVYSKVGYFRLTGEPEPGVEPLAWGAHQFSVFFDCEPYQVKETLKKVSQVVEREKPAHTQVTYCPVLPRMRVGVQSTLGIDTRVGEISLLLLGTTGTLGYDSILACSATELGGAVQPCVDVNTRLL
jgi:phage tail-like protein